MRRDEFEKTIKRIMQYEKNAERRAAYATCLKVWNQRTDRRAYDAMNYKRKKERKKLAAATKQNNNDYPLALLAASV